MSETEVIVGPDATRTEWLTARRQGIGGSDIAAILGLSRYSTPLAVWLEKRSTEPVVDDSPSEAAEWGTRLEPVIAELWAEKHPTHVMTYESPGLLARVGEPWMLATPDRFAWPIVNVDAGAADLGPVEVWEGKTAGLRQADRWADDRVPDEYAAQVLWYLAVTGARRAHVSCLIGGQEYVERTIERDEALIERIVDRAGDWWRRHIVEGVMPDPDPSRDGDVIGRVWGDLDTEPVDLSDVADVIADLRATRAAIGHLEQQETQLVTRIKAALGERTDGFIDGRPVVTWRRPKAGKAFDLKTFEAEHPDLAARYSRPNTPSRRFLLKDES